MMIDGRCSECDSRYCYLACGDVPGNVYIAGHGWAPLEVAIDFASNGYQVDGLNRHGYVGGAQHLSVYDRETRTWDHRYPELEKRVLHDADGLAKFIAAVVAADACNKALAQITDGS